MIRDFDSHGNASLSSRTVDVASRQIRVRKYYGSEVLTAGMGLSGMANWYCRPVFFVADVAVSRRFYEVLGFKIDWDRDDVAQVSRYHCEIILARDAERVGKGRLFIELEADEMRELRADIASRSIPVLDTWWGYPSLEIRDPDGNALFFPMDETNSDSALPSGFGEP